jgi:nitroreductase
MDYENLLKLAQKRRSVRRFKKDLLPDDYIDKIIEVARWAPSAFNTQPWEFVVVRDQLLRGKIVEIINTYLSQIPEMEKTREAWQGRPWKAKGLINTDGDYSEAPVYIILYGDIRTQVALPMGVRYEKQRKEILFTSSLANAFVYMHLAATTLGLASQWISGVQNAYANTLIRDLLGIPPEMEIFDMVALGYPALKPSDKFLRDREEMTHYDCCGADDFRSDEAVRDFAKKTRSWNIGVHNRDKQQT